MEEKPTNEDHEKSPQKGNAIIWIAIVALIIIAEIVYFSRGGNRPASPATNPSAPTSNSGSGIAAPSANDTAVKTFDISGKPFEFSMKEIRVKKGDKIRINLTSTAGMHDWVIDEFRVRTKIVQAGQSDSIEFIADKSGTFEYYCSVPTHRQQGMVGKLIVE
jgi:nitrite reductase (NO-forming)